MVATELIGNPNYIVIGKGPPTLDTNDKAMAVLALCKHSRMEQPVGGSARR